jgi:hypothetical protein
MILNDFCLLCAQFFYVILNVRTLESHIHIANRGAPWKIASDVDEAGFAVAAISIDGFLAHIPRRDRHKSLHT